MILGVIFIVTGFILLVRAFNYKKHLKEIDIETDNHNKTLAIYNNILLDKKQEVQKEIDISLNKLNQINSTIEETLNKQKDMSKKAFENYCDLLDTDYQNKEKEYDILCNNLYNAYAQKQDKLIAETEVITQQLETIRQTRAASIAAQIREKEIKEQLTFYCLTAKENELSDIKLLEKVKSQLNNPRILSMLIWQTYWQKPMTSLCNNVLGTSIVCGIYKITNQLTDECYIGQAVDVASRWKQHAKCGLGIDTPANNKLYKAMQEYGIWNFSWELIETCSSAELNQKEKYYIDLLQSYSFGYNSNTGINK